MFKLTPPLVNWPGPDCDNDREDGFTLIEILVVIIIIGILAAVAIPIFLNQQKAARDSATTQDTRNTATALESGLVYDDTATSFKAFEDAEGDTPYASPSGLAPGEEAVIVPGEAEEFYVQVGDGPITKTKKTEGTSLLISNDDIDGDGSPEAGAFRVDGWNEKGREYVSESTLVYRNALGGIQSERGTGGAGSEVGTPGDGTENPGGGSGETEAGDSDVSSYPTWRVYHDSWTADGGVPVPGDTSMLSTFLLSGTNSEIPKTIPAPDGIQVEYEARMMFYDPITGEDSYDVIATGSSTSSNGSFTAEYPLPARPNVDFDTDVHVVIQVTKLTFPDGVSLDQASSSGVYLGSADVAYLWPDDEFAIPTD